MNTKNKIITALSMLFTSFAFAENTDISGDLTVSGTIYDGVGSVLDLGINDLIRFNGGQVVINSANGYVGIGTTTPTRKLEIFNGGFSLRRTDGGNAQVHLDSNQGDVIFREQGALTGIFRFDSDADGATFNFQNRVGGVYEPRLYIEGSGDVGIGTTTPSHKLAVNGTVRAKEVIVDTGWSDFVFEDSYQLRTLGEVEAHIEEHGHLPDVPSASVVESQGLSVGEAQKIMMQKIEELTLYMIEQEKKNQAQQREIEELRKQLSLQNARYNSE